MASAHYNLALQEYIKASMGDMTANTVKVRLSRSSAYTFSQAHQFASSLAAAIVTDVAIGSKTANGQGSDPGSMDGADCVFTAVPAGAAIDSLIIYKDTGSAATSNLLCYIDGFSVTPNGGDITVQWQNTAPFIFKI